MARYEVQTNQPIYEVGQQWVDAALKADDSLFTPGRPIWSRRLLDELDERFIQHPDESTDKNFEQKLRGQLDGASPDAIQLMAEVLYVYYLPAFYNVKGDSKRAHVNTVLSWSPSPASVPPELLRVLDLGVGSGGPGFHLYRPTHVRYIIAFAQEWKRLPDDERGELLGDPWRFRTFAHAIKSDSNASYAREAILHLVFPDTFDRIFSFAEKGRVAAAISPVLAEIPDGVDARILAIRDYLSPRLGKDFDFFDAIPALVLWNPLLHRWDTFLYWASRFHGHPDFDRWERDYKIVIAEHMSAARDAVASGSDNWLATLKAAFGKPNNLTNFISHGKFLDWCQQNADDARAVLGALWEPATDPLLRLDEFLRQLPGSAVAGPGTRANIASLLLSTHGVEDFPPFKWEATTRAWTITGFGPPQVPNDAMALFRHAISFWDRMRELGASRGLQLRDRLDAQSVAWCVTNWGENELPESWPVEERAAIQRYFELARSGQTEEEPDAHEALSVAGVDDEFVAPSPVSDPLIALADELLLKHSDLAEIRDLLEAKGQVVLYGPPGTGKTFVARKLAAALAGAPERVRLVQFHASYAYEDFVEGFRPKDDGQPGFERKDGPFVRIAEAARSSPYPHYLVIDEMNRANLAKVFGELYFLLEYRDEPIELPYSRTEFRLPKNLRIIATMNTADRSIALVDYALRRRFAFIPFFPDQPPIAGLLERWLKRFRPEMEDVARLVALANGKLGDRNVAIGPSFFMRADLDDRRLDLVWRHEVIPYLEEFFFDEPGRLDGFALEALRSELGLTPPEETSIAPTELTDGAVVADPH